MLLQHKIAAAALVSLYNNGKEPEVLFCSDDNEFYINSVRFQPEIINAVESIITYEDIQLLQRAKIQLNASPLYAICGNKTKKYGNFELENINSIAGFAFHSLACFKTEEDAEASRELAKRITDALNGSKPDTVIIQMIKDHPDALEPRCAYHGTSAAFDVAAIKEVTIPAMNDKIVPIGVRFSIDQNQPYYMMVHMRSSLGFKHGIQCHQGIIDAGYTGDFGIKVFNRTMIPLTIKKGEYFAQVVVHKKPSVIFNELNPKQWQEYEEKQLRGSGGFGSSGK